MTKLIIYINSEQSVSAYIEDGNDSYSVSFDGNEYESDLSRFAEIVMQELRSTPLSKMEAKGGISILIVSNGAANETVRTVIGLLMHDDDEDGILNVNIQELNVVEAKYFLHMIGKPENPCAKDFVQFFDLSQKAMTSESEVEDLMKKNAELEEKVKKLNELKDSKDSTIHEMENKLKKVEIDKVVENLKKQEEEKLSESIYKIDFLRDAENTGVAFYLPKGEKVTFLKTYKNGDKVSYGSAIASYYKIDSNFISSLKMYTNNGIKIFAKRSGKIYYFVNNNSEVCNGDVVAVIGEDSWTKDDADDFLKQSQNPENKKKSLSL